MKKEIFESGAIILLVALIFLLGYLAGTQERSLAVSEASINMSGRTGLYYLNKEVYCVKIAGRTLEEMEKTECHELCHYSTQIDYEHFCTDKDVKVSK